MNLSLGAPNSAKRTTMTERDRKCLIMLIVELKSKGWFIVLPYIKQTTTSIG
jgi:hypothetical protein